MIASSHSYCSVGCSPRYTCVDFTVDLVLALRARGIYAYPVCGWLNHRRHAWVVVEEEPSRWLWASENEELIHIEPQTAKIVKPYGWNYLRGRRCIVRGIY